MARYHTRSRYRHNYAARHMSERSALSHTFAGIDADIERIFLSLPKHHLESVFARYSAAHGAKAESYARQTYEEWKSKAVKMSGQTAERLLNLVPPGLSAEARFELIKKLRSGHLRPTHQTVVTTPQTWRHDLDEPIRTLVSRSATFSLPDHITKRATWLANGDAAAAHSLLAAAEQEEAIMRVRYLDAEFRRIEVLILNIEHTRSVTHTISLPQDTIVVTIALPQKTLWQSVTAWIS